MVYIDNLTIEQVISGNYRSHLRNKQIANISKGMGLIEKYGSGIKRVIDTFSSYGLREPLFESRENGFLVTVWNKKETTQETTQETIVRLLKENPKYTRNDLAKLIGKSNSTIKIYLAELKKNGLIERIGSTKSGSWKVNRK